MTRVSAFSSVTLSLSKGEPLALRLAFGETPVELQESREAPNYEKLNQTRHVDRVWTSLRSLALTSKERAAIVGDDVDLPSRPLPEAVDEKGRHHQVADGEQTALRSHPHLRGRLHPGTNPPPLVGDSVDAEGSSHRNAEAGHQQDESSQAPRSPRPLVLAPTGEALRLHQVLKEHESSCRLWP